MNKHTPGPWTIETINKDHARIWTAENSLIAELYHPHGPFYPTLANASLIAAAPDLLEALEHITQTPEYKFLYPGTVSMIEQAISKAKGRQS